MQQPRLTVKEYCLQKHYSDRAIDGDIPYLIGRWERIAERVVDYQHFYLDDYLNDLDGRQLLAELLPLAPESELAEIMERVEAADARFIANSLDAPSCVWGLEAETKYQYTKQQNWWYYRLPKQVGPAWNSPDAT